MNLSIKNNALKEKFETLLQSVDATFAVDKIIFENAPNTLRCLASISKTIDTMHTTDWEQIDLTPHPLSYNDIFYNNSSLVTAHDSVRAWRDNPSSKNYNKIPFKIRKEVFDCFFRHDVHGKLDNTEMDLLSRGTPDPLFFAPPSIVKSALHLASNENWFGYSDSLGHIETRQAIASLERVRRNIPTLDSNNCAVIMGGTQGLHAILTLIRKEDKREKCIILTPNYAPIIDDASNIFDIETLPLNTDFSINMEELEKSLYQLNVAVLIISWPHNPANFKDAEKNLRRIMDICAERSVYCIVDEITFNPYELLEKDLQNPYFISINSYSKTYNIPGLKLGHIVASKSFLDRFYSHASTTYGSPVSFLYLCITMLAIAEANYRTRNMAVPYPQQVLDACSNPELLQEDFNIWRDTHALVRQSQEMTVHHILNVFGFEEGDFFGIDDGSPNMILRTHADITSYEMMLTIIHETNVSVFPIDCFLPPQNWPCDLRITYSVPPDRLAVSLSKVLKAVRNYQSANLAVIKDKHAY